MFVPKIVLSAVLLFHHQNFALVFLFLRLLVIDNFAPISFVLEQWRDHGKGLGETPLWWQMRRHADFI